MGVQDVAYAEDRATAACVLADDWHSAKESRIVCASIDSPAPYASGRFFERELPCLLAVLGRVGRPPEIALVDGYVWLPGGVWGLGAHLYHALQRSVTVVGVAKSAFAGAAFAVPVYRGESRRPIFVTAVGIDEASAARHVALMSGRYRIPTLLARADQAARKPPAGSLT
ncbi:MAG: endonuclease V [Deltaproteobacteria bacterium]|nr:endonuclease V [Deltaproteobacteria bacterium]